jgi:hypothetical protein
MQIACAKNSHAKKMLGRFLKLILLFFAFMLVNQNIHAQLFTYLKNHCRHMNYFILDYSNFLTSIFFM